MRYMVVIERRERVATACSLCRGHVLDWIWAKSPRHKGRAVATGCIAVGETREEVVRLIREAIDLHIESLRQDGLSVPSPSSESEFVEVSAA
ncbi:MAG: hypothetical protein A3G20_05865 [Acidobacteria bacterium RIFCSPLOWO2_12_FULL_59_11]|nr:MAG: hypothetical protein A3G20_05865 [Acidobacteria bacterium RIFCSPLOWO2_12_FULL_59_11]